MGYPSRFAGLINASDFAYGINKSASSLIVTAGPNATGTGALTLAFGFTNLNDGTIINPLNTNAPIIVGGGSAEETVTPTAVSASTPTIYSSTTVTASFANLHGNGDQVRSGTCGLQEALNFAGSLGGGVVVIDSGWVSLGGAQAMVAAATIPANVGLMDLRFGMAPATFTYTLTNAQILGMEASPVELLPAPGANSYWQLWGATVANLNTGTAYASGGAITIGYGSTASPDALSGTIAATFLTSPTATEVISVGAGLGTNQAGTSVLNKGIYITNATGAFTTGTGTLQVTLFVTNITT